MDSTLPSDHLTDSTRESSMIEDPYHQVIQRKKRSLSKTAALTQMFLTMIHLEHKRLVQWGILTTQSMGQVSISPSSSRFLDCFVMMIMISTIFSKKKKSSLSEWAQQDFPILEKYQVMC